MKRLIKVSTIIFFIGILFTKAFANELENEVDSKIRVACIGNSITYGMKLANREKESFPSVLQSLLGDKYKVGNFGKNGATLLFKGHRPYSEQTEYKNALDFNPDILVIHLGVNDTDPRDFPDYGDEFTKDYLSLIDSFKKINPDVRVIIANLSPLLAKHPRFKSGTRAWRDSIRNLIPTIAQSSGAELIDFADVLKDRPNLIPDGIHPDKEGAKLLAQKVYGAITGDFGGLELPEIYGDRMVLQRYQPIIISGKADAGDSITVILGNIKKHTITDNQGNWTVTLPSLPEQTGLKMTVTNKKDSLKFKDIAIGEVWIASGQSNMEFQMKLSSTWENDQNNSEDSLLRIYNMKPSVYTIAKEWSEEKKQLTDNLQYYTKSEWQKSNNETIKDFSAVAWHFGKTLRDSLNVAVGIISNSVGGSPIESWIDIETLEHDMPEILIDWRTNDYLQPWVQQRIGENVGEINDSVSHRHPYEPSYLFSTGIRPLASYPIAGTVWYQGESNAHNIEIHESLFESLLASWRNFWRKPEMPFIFVQLSSIDRPSWPKFRDSQRRLAEKNANVWMVVSSDLGDSLDVHPKNKKPIGERLARQALKQVYSFNQIVPQGPNPIKAYHSAENEVIIEFDYADGLKASEGKDLIGLELAGSDGLFYKPQNIKIINDKVVIRNTNIEMPEYVRYGWQPFTRANLVNGEGLPVSTFKLKIESLKDNSMEEGLEYGLSGSFIGKLGNELIMAGGCNFPDNPLAPDSKKKFYQGIYKLFEDEFNGWQVEKIGNLPEPIAYGSSVSVPKGLLLIGGNSSTNSSSKTYLIKREENGEIVLLPYPSLPGTIDNAYATYLEGKAYIAGGNFNGKPSNKLFSLDLNNLDSGWKELSSFPGNPRIQPVLGGAKKTDNHEYLYIWGGFAGKENNREASLNTDGLRYDIRKNKWEKTKSPVDHNGEEVSLGGGTITILNDGKMVASGGVNKEIFLEALKNPQPDYLSHNIDWYKFNPIIFIFNPSDEKWDILKVTSETARAGAGSVSTPSNEIIIVGGEIKPRIRTPKIYKLKL